MSPIEKVIADPRPFSDPTHPIHQHGSIKPHPEDYPAPTPYAPGELDITFCGDGLIKIDGILCSVEVIKQLVRCEASDRLHCFTREGNHVTVLTVSNAQAAAEFFAGKENA